MTTLKTSAVLCLTLAMFGCLGPDYSIGTTPITQPAKSGVDPVIAPGIPFTTPSTNPFSLEVETFTLVDAEIKSLPDASGGKAVLLGKPTSSAKTTIMLQKGTYEVTLYISATDPDHDALLLTLAGEEHRVYTNDYDHTVPVDETVALEMKADGPCTIAIIPAETGINVDKVVFKRVK